MEVTGPHCKGRGLLALKERRTADRLRLYEALFQTLNQVSREANNAMLCVNAQQPRARVRSSQGQQKIPRIRYSLPVPATNIDHSLALEDRLVEQRAKDLKRIQHFWSWWSKEQGQFKEAIENGRLKDYSEAITAKVHEIRPELVWSMGREREGHYALTVSAEGDPKLSLLVEDWQKSSPPSDEGWQILGSAPPEPCQGISLKSSGVAIDFDRFSFLAQQDNAAEMLHIASYHPNFRELPEEQRDTITYLFLSRLLGEEELTRWIGEIQHMDTDPRELSELPEDARYCSNGGQLRETVAELAAQASGEGFVVLQGQTPEGPVIGTLNAALKRINHPSLHWHLDITIHSDASKQKELRERQDNAALTNLEDDLLERLQNEVVFVGSEATPDLGKRRLHLYLACVRETQSHLLAWEESFPEWKIEWAYTYDPSWEVRDREFF